MFHIVLALVLVRVFAPGVAAPAIGALNDALTVTLLPQPAPLPEPQVLPPPSKPQQAKAPGDEGAAAPAGKRAKPKDTAVPKAPIVVEPTVAPQVAGHGDEVVAGAADAGSGTGAGGLGQGTGAGRRGSGQGGGGAVRPTVKIAGDINSARDYPRATRDLRIGHSVVIDLGVGVDGRVSACRVVRASPDPDADRITCDLARARFRFRPATNAAGEAVAATFRWQQRWFVN